MRRPMTPERRDFLRQRTRADRAETRAHPGNARPAPPLATLTLADRQRSLLMRLFGADWQRAEARMEQFAAQTFSAGGTRRPVGEG